MLRGIESITIKGFKSFKEVLNFPFNDLNVIIGPNGAGKSNLIQIFHMLSAMANNNFSKFIISNGGADNFLFNGPENTEKISLEFTFTSRYGGKNSYLVELTPTVNETFMISEYRKYNNNKWSSYGDISLESRLSEQANEKSSLFETRNGVGYFIYDTISEWTVYHFHNTSSNAPMRRSEIIEDNQRLRSNGSNIAPVLFSIKNRYPEIYDKIVASVRLVIPSFDDFILRPVQNAEETRIKLMWKQKGSDFPLQPYHLSDGSIRFICLATALLQPEPPSVIVIDEPELGLHPAAIPILAELIQSASEKIQVIIATQHPLLVDQFDIKNIIIISHRNGESQLENPDPNTFSSWLEDYTLGDLWMKNVLSD